MRAGGTAERIGGNKWKSMKEGRGRTVGKNEKGGASGEARRGK